MPIKITHWRVIYLCMNKITLAEVLGVALRWAIILGVLCFIAIAVWEIVKAAVCIAALLIGAYIILLLVGWIAGPAGSKGGSK